MRARQSWPVFRQENASETFLGLFFICSQYLCFPKFIFSIFSTFFMFFLHRFIKNGFYCYNIRVYVIWDSLSLSLLSSAVLFTIITRYFDSQMCEGIHCVLCVIYVWMDSVMCVLFSSTFMIIWNNVLIFTPSLCILDTPHIHIFMNYILLSSSGNYYFNFWTHFKVMLWINHQVVLYVGGGVVFIYFTFSYSVCTRGESFPILVLFILFFCFSSYPWILNM